MISPKNWSMSAAPGASAAEQPGSTSSHSNWCHRGSVLHRQLLERISRPDRVLSAGQGPSDRWQLAQRWTASCAFELKPRVLWIKIWLSCFKIVSCLRCFGGHQKQVPRNPPTSCAVSVPLALHQSLGWCCNIGCIAVISVRHPLQAASHSAGWLCPSCRRSHIPVFVNMSRLLLGW